MSNLGASYHIRVLCYARDSKAVEALQKEGVEVRTSEGLGRFGRTTILAGAFSVSREIGSFMPDVIISMYLWSDFLTALALLWRGLRGKRPAPHIVHLAGDPVPPVASSAMKRIYSAVVGFYLKRADKVICISRSDMEMISSRFGIEKKNIEVIPIGINISASGGRASVHDPVVFGVVSRLSAEKNIGTIIRAVKGAITNGGRMRLEIYGDGAEEENLKCLVGELGLSEHVSFHGWIENPLEAFDVIDCLIMFSETEGTPRAIMEAGDRSVPVIAKEVGGIGEIVVESQTGYLVKTEEELLDRMMEYINYPHKILQMGGENREYIEGNHSITCEISKLTHLIGGLSLLDRLEGHRKTREKGF